MSDSPHQTLLEQLDEIREDLRGLRTKASKLAQRIESREADEQAVIRVLELQGQDVPSAAGELVPIRRRRSGGVRAIDAALQVTTPSEEVSKQDVAQRVAIAVEDFRSKNPENALATAMHRSELFENLGGGLFLRIATHEEDKAAIELVAAQVFKGGAQ